MTMKSLPTREEILELEDGETVDLFGYLSDYTIDPVTFPDNKTGELITRHRVGFILSDDRMNEVQVSKFVARPPARKAMPKPNADIGVRCLVKRKTYEDGGYSNFLNVTSIIAADE